MKKNILLATVATSLLILSACTAPSPTGGGNSGSIGNPLKLMGLSDLDSTSSRVTLLSGSTTDERGDSGVAIVTNSMGITETQLDVSNGSYQQSVEVASGSNTVRVNIYENGELVETAQSTVVSSAERVPVRVRMSWNTPTNDVDLYITAPDNTVCYYDHKSPSWGYLDIDDTDGFGPETFSLTDPISGTYVIGVNYYDNEGITTPVKVIFQISFNEGTWENAGTYTFQPSDADNGNTIVKISSFNF